MDSLYSRVRSYPLEYCFTCHGVTSHKRVYGEYLAEVKAYRCRNCQIEVIILFAARAAESETA